MRAFLIIIFSIFIVNSCSEKKNGNEIDCNSDKNKAQNDFKYKNYIWTDYEQLFPELLGNEEFITLLEKNKIKHKTVSLSCMDDGYAKFRNCYEDEMNHLLKNKFGKSFFDSLKIVGKKEFIFKNKDSIYFFSDCDMTSRHPNTTDYNRQFELEDSDFFKNFKYPKSYIKRKNQKELYSFTTTSFVLMKDGSTKNFKTESDFQIPSNKIFETNFNKQVEKYVKSISWKPATIENIPVNSEMDITITYQ